jgi:hypothetical protein
MRAKTVGFAISDKDRELLDRLSDHYGNGNRSEFLRLAMKRMEHERIAQRFIETRKQINEELGGRVLTSEEVLEAIKVATAN